MATAIELLVDGERECDHVGEGKTYDSICGDCAAEVVSSLLTTIERLQAQVARLTRENHEHAQVRAEISTGLGLMRRQLEAAIAAGRADLDRTAAELGLKITAPKAAE